MSQVKKERAGLQSPMTKKTIVSTSEWELVFADKSSTYVSVITEKAGEANYLTTILDFGVVGFGQTDSIASQDAVNKLRFACTQANPSEYLQAGQFEHFQIFNGYQELRIEKMPVTLTEKTALLA